MSEEIKIHDEYMKNHNIEEDNIPPMIWNALNTVQYIIDQKFESLQSELGEERDENKRLVNILADSEEDNMRLSDENKRLREELEEMEEAGKEATSLIAHLKDQYGFNDSEQESQDKIMDIFKYEGDW